MKKYDSFCVECKQPAQSPKGNFNARRVTLCERKTCRRKRKTELQKARRRQLQMRLGDVVAKAGLAVFGGRLQKVTGRAEKLKIARKVLQPVKPNARRPRKIMVSGTSRSNAVKVEAVQRVTAAAAAAEFFDKSSS